MLREAPPRGSAGPRLGPLVLLLALATPARAAAQTTSQPPADCSTDPAFHVLDFWLGDWRVTVGNQEVGHDRVERILGGCAIMEHWRGATGDEGKSLFYYDPRLPGWRQVWVTTRVAAPGGLKEKHLVARYPDGGVRFQGERPGPGGTLVFDRTTLTPMDGGRVHQVIETSADGGASWRAGFDAIYSPSGTARP